MIIHFTALTRREGSFSLQQDELEEAKRDGVDIENHSEVAAYFLDKWSESRVIEDVVQDESSFDDTEIVEWSAG